MYKNRLPCFCTQPHWVGTQDHHGFFLMTRDHIKLLLNLPILGTHLLPLPPFQVLGSFPTQNQEPEACLDLPPSNDYNLQGILANKVFLYLSLSDPKIYEDLLL